MALKRLDHTGIVVDDLPAAIDFFTALGMELVGQAPVSGEWADKLTALDGLQADIAMLRTPDGNSQVELSVIHSPKATSRAPWEPVSTPGIPRLAFVVDDVDETFERLRPHGAALVGEIAQYEDYVRYGYVRGPAGVIIGLIQELS